MVFWQSKKQMVELLGRDRGESLLEQPVTSIYMTMAPASAKAVSDAIGERQIDRIENAPQNGAVGGKTKRTINEPVIFPSELTGLAARTEGAPKGVELTVHLVGAGVLGKLVNPFPEHRDPIAEPFVESETWKRGSLPDVPAEAAAPILAADDRAAAGDADDEAGEGDESDESDDAEWSGL